MKYTVLTRRLKYSRITAAAFFNLDKFDFANRPGGILYIGAYLVALAGALIILAAYRSTGAAAKRAA